MASSATSAPPTVHQLRSRWKPHKERFEEQQEDQSTSIRIHRACSWLGVVERMGERPDYDQALLNHWIAFNALYGQWDIQKQEPMADRPSWRSFMDRILALDADGQLAEALQGQRGLVMKMLDDEYLSQYFWEEPSQKRANQSKKAKFSAQTWYHEGNWTLILDRVLERVYLVRCQLVHGAATHGSKLNRTAVHRCCSLLGRLLPAILTVMIDHGADEDWGTMCYPPLGTISTSNTRRSFQPNKPR